MDLGDFLTDSGVAILSDEEAAQFGGFEEQQQQQQQPPSDGNNPPPNNELQILSDEELAARQGQTQPPSDDNTGVQNAPQGGQTNPDGNNGGVTLSKWAEIAKTIAEEKSFDITEDELKEIKDPASFAEFIDNQAAKRAESLHNNFKESLPDSGKIYLGLKEAGVPENDAITLSRDIEYFNSIDEEQLKDNVDLKKEVYSAILSIQGVNGDTAKDIIEDAVALDKIDEKIEKAGGLKAITTHLDNTKKTIEEAAKQRMQQDIESRQTAYQTMVNEVKEAKELVKGMPYNDKIKQALLKNMETTTKVGGRELNPVQAKMVNNKANMTKLLHYYDALGLFNFDKDGNIAVDVTDLAKKFTSDGLAKLEKTIENIDTPTYRGSLRQQGGEQADEGLESLKQFL